MSKIVTKNLCKVFGATPRRAWQYLQEGKSKDELQENYGLTVGVWDVSLEINAGEVFVLMGLSGSGKSTLLRLLNMLHYPTSGEVIVDGTDISRLSRRELIQFRREKFSGMVFQQFAILPHRSVLGNVEYGLEVQGMKAKKRRERAMDIIEMVGLKGWAKSYPAQLSGGMRQRVGLARALAVEADILLMDEAFSALDPLIRREMQDELLELQTKMGRTIVFVTHDLDEALRLGDRIAIMRDGKVVQIGTAEAIIAKPANDYVAAFVEGINQADVLMASSIMQPPRETAHIADGPKTVLHKMERQGFDGLFVTDSERYLKGYIRADVLANAVQERGKTLQTLEPAFIQKAVTVHEDMVLSDIINIACDSSQPIAVIDDQGRLQGVIIKGVILAALAKRGTMHPEQLGASRPMAS